LNRDAQPRLRNHNQGMPWAGAVPPTTPTIPPVSSHAD